jgi:uncharacterized membrane protein
VHEITSTSGTIQRTLKHAVKYPPNDATAQPRNRATAQPRNRATAQPRNRATAQPTIDFSTQVPSFANNTELSNLLQRHGVTIAPAR